MLPPYSGLIRKFTHSLRLGGHLSGQLKACRLPLTNKHPIFISMVQLAAIIHFNASQADCNVINEVDFHDTVSTLIGTAMDILNCLKDIYKFVNTLANIVEL